MQPCSYAWRGFRGVGKRTQLLGFIETLAKKNNISFEIKKGTWFLTKQSNGVGDPDDEDEGESGKSIPYEESNLHLGFDVARMSMSDKVFLQSILARWTGYYDICLSTTTIKSRYLVLYHAHYLTDESVLQLQEYLEQYPMFALLVTTELPLCSRLRDFCLEIPVVGDDRLLANYTKRMNIPDNDVWLYFFKKTISEWSADWTLSRISEVRNWIYICLQRNLRWTDVITYWIQAIYDTDWITPKIRSQLLYTLWKLLLLYQIGFLLKIIEL